MNKRQILVIGTEPPCPRCDLLYRMIDEMLENRDDIYLSHCSFAIHLKILLLLIYSNSCR